MAKPEVATLLVGLITAGIVGMATGGLLHRWLVDPPRQTKSQRFLRRWIAWFLAYFSGLCVITVIAGPSALRQIRPRLAGPDWAPSDEPITWGMAVGVALIVSLLAAASATFLRRPLGHDDDGARDA